MQRGPSSPRRASKQASKQATKGSKAGKKYKTAASTPASRQARQGIVVGKSGQPSPGQAKPGMLAQARPGQSQAKPSTQPNQSKAQTPGMRCPQGRGARSKRITQLRLAPISVSVGFANTTNNGMGQTVCSEVWIKSGHDSWCSNVSRWRNRIHSNHACNLHKTC